MTLLSNCLFREETFRIVSLMASRIFKTSEQIQVLRCDSKGNKYQKYGTSSIRHLRWTKWIKVRVSDLNGTDSRSTAVAENL